MRLLSSWLLATSLFLLSQALLAVDTLPPGQEVARNGTFNDPASALEFWQQRAGGLGTFKVTKGQEEGAIGILNIRVTETSPKPWNMELLQRVDVEVEKATTMYISFEYKISPGYSFNFYWQEERSPWPKLLSLHVESPTETWQRVQMAAPVHQTFQPQTTAFSFHLAENVGILQLRNFSAIMVPAEVNPETLVTNVNPVLGGDFYDKDWRGIVSARLEKIRRFPLTVEVTRKGRKIGDADIAVRQTSRPFRFGVEASAALLAPAALAAPEIADFAARVKPHAAGFERYRDLILNTPQFEFVTFYDAMVWRDYAAWGQKIDAEVLAAAKAAARPVRGHALFIPAYKFAPNACRNLNRDALNKALLDHVSQICTRHKGAVAEWNTVHGAIEYFEIYNFIGVDCISQVFAAARAADPAASLLLSDIQALSALSDVPLRDTLELAEWLQQSGVQVDGVVLGANLKRLDVGPQSMEKRLDQLSARVKAPIHIANFAVNADSDEIQASMVRDYLLLFYSHPAVVSVSFAEPWAPAILNPRMAFYSDDFTPRPATEAIFKLLDEEWRTVADLKTDGTGAAPTIDAFIGVYEMTVTIGKETFPAVNVQLPPPADSATAPLTVPGATVTTTKTGVKVTLQVP